MCINNSVPFRSDTPIIAYKVMEMRANCPNRVVSLLAGNLYELGNTEYEAGEPRFTSSVISSDLYSKGFHAYVNLEDAQIKCEQRHWLCIVKVEISELTFKGTETIVRKNCGYDVPTYVANKCKFLKIVKKYVYQQSN